MTCELYRHFDQSGRLIYVGISNSALFRTASHKSQSSWFDLITRIEIERYPTREAALAAEELAITNENPIYNLRNGRRVGTLARNPALQAEYEAALLEAQAKGIKVNKGRSAGVIRAQIAMAEKGIKYPYDIDEQLKWEAKQKLPEQ